MRPTADRFWEKVCKTRTCWFWTGAVLTDGYGAFKMLNGKTGGQQCRAHRIAWELTYGTIPAGPQVLHKCDQPLCVRPDHLFLGTCADNMRDKCRKGRQARLRGSQRPSAKLSEHDVCQIRTTKGKLQRELAQQYGVEQGTISNILNRKTWTHI